MVLDEQVQLPYGDRVQGSLRQAGVSVGSIVIPSGEASKSHGELIRIYDAALAAGLDRSSWLLALGGGVVGDLAGYAAATYLRGVPLVQIPTTLLAMVDSAVGGKTGINLTQGKNLIGAFHQPSLVLADTDTLHTLPDREFCAGLAEIVKYGLIVDPSILSVLEETTPAELKTDAVRLESLIERSCAIKAGVVAEDEREGGLRAILNFGHTLAHAIEQVSGYGTYLHGEAVAIGMCYAARLSERLRDFPPSATTRLRAVLTRYRLPVTTPDAPWDRVLAAMNRDKKRKAGVIGFVLLDEPGKAVFGCPVPEHVLASVWREGGA